MSECENVFFLLLPSNKAKWNPRLCQTKGVRRASATCLCLLDLRLGWNRVRLLIVLVLMIQIADTPASTLQAVQGSAVNLLSVTLNLPQKAWWDLSPHSSNYHQHTSNSSSEGIRKRWKKGVHMNRFQIRQGLKSMETFGWLWTLDHNLLAAESSHSSFLLFGEFIYGLSHLLKLCFAGCYWGSTLRWTEVNLKAYIL